MMNMEHETSSMVKSGLMTRPKTTNVITVTYAGQNSATVVNKTTSLIFSTLSVLNDVGVLPD